jgi:hypothetical protein
MGVRQSATIIFADDLGRRSEKKLKEVENGKDTAGGDHCIYNNNKTCLGRFQDCGRGKGKNM